MAGARSGTSRRPKGSIDALPSGALRVRVYAGVDPVTKRRHDLIEVVPPGPQAERQARAVRDRLISEVEQRRNPRTRATVDQLLERYLEQFDGAPNTLTLYRGYVRNHISPLLGHVRAAQLDAEMLDAFYAELRRCRAHCTSRRTVDHRTSRPHECDDRCRPHRCRPLGPTTVRHMHFILSGAFKRAVRWRWVAVSPVGQAEPPAAPKPNPEPPTPAEAARIVAKAWRDPDWGTLLWTAMTTGARRGELCAVRWSLVDLTEGRETVWLRRAIRKEGGRLVEAELKTHQQRRIALDAETVAVLREHHERCRARATALGFELAPDAFVFSGVPDGASFALPDSVTQRYGTTPAHPRPGSTAGPRAPRRPNYCRGRTAPSAPACSSTSCPVPAGSPTSAPASHQPTGNDSAGRSSAGPGIGARRAGTARIAPRADGWRFTSAGTTTAAPACRPCAGSSACARPATSSRTSATPTSPAGPTRPSRTYVGSTAGTSPRPSPTSTPPRRSGSTGRPASGRWTCRCSPAPGSPSVVPRPRVNGPQPPRVHLGRPACRPPSAGRRRRQRNRSTAPRRRDVARNHTVQARSRGVGFGG
jgi:integrase